MCEKALQEGEFGSTMGRTEKPGGVGIPGFGAESPAAGGGVDSAAVFAPAGRKRRAEARSEAGVKCCTDGGGKTSFLGSEVWPEHRPPAEEKTPAAPCGAAPYAL